MTGGLTPGLTMVLQECTLDQGCNPQSNWGSNKKCTPDGGFNRWFDWVSWGKHTLTRGLTPGLTRIVVEFIADQGAARFDGGFDLRFDNCFTGIYT